MKPLEHLSEAALIEFHLHDSDHEAAVLQHLETCAECARLSDSIAETLHVFSADPVPESNLYHKWQQLREALLVVASAPEGRFRFSLWSWSMAGFALVAIVLVLFATLAPGHPGLRYKETAAINRPGPFTTAPDDSQIAEQLDIAERLLTVVNHTSGTLDDATREQAHDLLLKNVADIRVAREQGDFGTAEVLDNLGRVLTNIDNEPKSRDDGSHLRLEWNTSGLLFDVRILQQATQGSRPFANKENQ